MVLPKLFFKGTHFHREKLLMPKSTNLDRNGFHGMAGSLIAVLFGIQMAFLLFGLLMSLIMGG